MADWEKVIGTIANTIVAGSKVYATTVIAQAQVGLFDTQKKTLNTQISLLKDTALTQKENTENAKKVNQIKNKIVYGQYITEDEYNFLVGFGYDVGFSYNDYIDYISSGGASIQTQSQVQSQSENIQQSNLSKYLLYGTMGILGFFIFKKVRG